MNISKVKPLLISLCITAFEFVVFTVWGLSMNGGDEMGFCLITTYFLFPLTTLVLSAYIAHKSPVFLLAFVPLMFAAQNFMPYLIFGTFEIGLILCFTLIPSALGIAEGLIYQKLSK